jgi:hypothetical protein
VVAAVLRRSVLFQQSVTAPEHPACVTTLPCCAVLGLQIAFNQMLHLQQ